MTKPWENDNCENIKAYYTYYKVPVAAALWCKVPPDQVDSVIQECEEIGRAIFRHPKIPCIEPRCRKIHEAINSGDLPVSREDYKPAQANDHVAPERRHVQRQALKEWIQKEFPSDRPEFLFDEVERGIHPAINKDTYLALQADLNSKDNKISDHQNTIKLLNKKVVQLELENASFKDIVDKKYTPNSISQRRLNNINKVLAAMAKDGYGYNPKDSKSPVPSEVSKAITLHCNDDLTAATVREILKDAFDKI